MIDDGTDSGDTTDHAIPCNIVRRADDAEIIARGDATNTRCRSSCSATPHSPMSAPSPDIACAGRTAAGARHHVAGGACPATVASARPRARARPCDKVAIGICLSWDLDEAVTTIAGRETLGTMRAASHAAPATPPRAGPVDRRSAVTTRPTDCRVCTQPLSDFARQLAAALRARLEVVYVDDGSSDDTLAVARACRPMRSTSRWCRCRAISARKPPCWPGSIMPGAARCCSWTATASIRRR